MCINVSMSLRSTSVDLENCFDVFLSDNLKILVTRFLFRYFSKGILYSAFIPLVCNLYRPRLDPSPNYQINTGYLNI